MQCRDIYFADPLQMHFNMLFMGFLYEFTDDLKDIIINEITFWSIYRKYTVRWNQIQRFTQVYFIQKSYIAVQLDMVNFSYMLYSLTDFIFGFKIILNDKINRNQKAYAYTDQQVGT